MLTEYSDSDQIKSRLPESARSDYIVDLMSALQSADRSTAFQIRAHVGNHTLFMTGIFPKNLKHRMERRGAPDLDYYERMGAANFRMASCDPLARKHDIADVLGSLAELFHETRLILNDVSERYLSIDDSEIEDLFQN